ncbi:SusC/RagA family TonB-linked outer membrane protein [Ohtaekwangia koreensis]|uniref:TonB-linked outer membrane protein, SusC/RagA family n=1 Tax=Ohtaekwangia koreensis TaxID=688867 RepID=A0A1T5J2H3_9BACT|nr:SusC/RagA family TonB-linked outer membrane protein [Ohtaekwangia koreensis]SKC45649.1 TonB-linked outer membrane protein, SusC/RagA family [Ohtaekwangia koreensis]
MKKQRLVVSLKTAVRTLIVQPVTAVLILYIACVNPVAAQILDQRISVSTDETEIREILDIIHEKAGIKFVYSSTAVPVEQKASLHVENETVENILEDLFRQAEIKFKEISGQILLYDNSKEEKTKEKRAPSGGNAERWVAFTLQGKVTDQRGEGMPGVNILLKGTTIGTTSDRDGAFVLSLPDEHKEGSLIFSFVGYQPQEVPISSKTDIQVKLLEDVTALGEVVVNGYQEIRKESFTGTAITVSGEDLKKVNPMNLFKSIQAYDPSFRVEVDNQFGSDPNKLPDITVRGETGLPSTGATTNDNLVSRRNLNNPNNPTFILNGFEVGIQNIYDLDINRVASITILKDAAATAIYGSRAANGVVIITLKKPEEGKLQFSFNYELTTNNPDLSVYDVLNAEQKLDYELLAGVYDATRDYNNTYTQDQHDQRYYDRRKSVVSGVNSYWLSEPVETSIGHNASVGVEGGSDVLLYNVTARYQTMKGVMIGSERERAGLDVTLGYHLRKFHFNNTLSIAQVNAQESRFGSFSNFVRMNPYYAKRDANGNISQEIDQWQKRETEPGEEGNSKVVSEIVLNPSYNATLNSFNKSAYTQIINSFSVSWNILTGLDLRGQLSLNKTLNSEDMFNSPFSNQYYTWTSGDDLKKRGEYQYKTNNELTYDGNMVLSLHKTLRKHFVNASLGTNIRDYSSDFKGFRAIGFANDRFDNVGFANAYRDDDYPVGWYSQEKLLGFFFSGNYSMADKYLADISVRLDGSSKFGPDNKYAPFWSVGIGWNLHKEKFLARSKVINQLKIRASTGLTGEVSFDSYLASTTYEYYQDWYSSGVGAVVKAYGNEDLRWQRTQNYDIGIETNLFQNRVYFSPRYYYRLTDDLVADIVVPPSLGFVSYKSNLGQMENRGFEFNMRANILRGKKWFVDIFGNGSRNINTIKKISESLKKYNDEIDKQQEEGDNKSVPLLRYREGESLSTIYAVQSLGIDPENGKEIFQRKDGTLTYGYNVRDIVPVGSTAPDLEGNFGADIGYGNFIISFYFYTKFGGDLFNQTLIDRVENADPHYNVDVRVLNDRWRQPGDHAMYKDIMDWEQTRASSRFVQQENTVELRSVNLSYEVPGAITNKWHMRTLRFSLTANDVWRKSSIKMERGIDYPFARTVTFAIQSRF